MPRLFKPDATWRIIGRGVWRGMDLDMPHPEGRDCYLFQRAGGDKPTDIWTLYYMPVDTFWGCQDG